MRGDQMIDAFIEISGKGQHIMLNTTDKSEAIQMIWDIYGFWVYIISLTVIEKTENSEVGD